MLRGCVFKPRTRPGSFQGMGHAGLPLLDEARRLTGLPVIAEPLEVDDIDLLRGHVDALMIGARSMHNTPLLRAAGQSGMTVIVKRGMSATYDEWLAAAEYVTGEGNTQVILCERGIRTFETATRNTLDVSAIAVLREMTDLPIAVDPSHAAGKASWVPSLAVAALAAGADALIVECHPDPETVDVRRGPGDHAAALAQDRLGIARALRDDAARGRRVRQRMSRGDRHHRRRGVPDARVPRGDGGGGAAPQGSRHRFPFAMPTESRRSSNACPSVHPRLGGQRVDRLVRAIIDECLDAVADEAAVPA